MPVMGGEKMIRGDRRAGLRLVLLAVLALAVWGAAKYAQYVPQPLGLAAPANVFSAARADATLGRILGPEIPHPLSSDENALVRARIVREFASLGIAAQPYRAFGCRTSQRYAVVLCGTVTNLLAPVLSASGGEGASNDKAIVMLAHYDSVPAGPGAADDGSGVASVLETARALRASGTKSKHPVLAVITDGEEAGLLGAAAYVDNSVLLGHTGAVVNVEARGNQGRSQLFQTSAGNAPLIALYAKSAGSYASSSLYEEIYKRMPNDTDLTLFLGKGMPAFNFAFTGRVAHYHTPLDRRENLSAATLQQQGDNLFDVTHALMTADFASLAPAGNAVYLDLQGVLLPRMPASWALPIAIILLLLLIVATLFARARKNSPLQWLAAFAMPPALLLAAGLMGWLLFTIAALLSGMPDPSYAYPLVLRWSLGLGVVFSALLVMRFAHAHALAMAVWLWFAALGVVTAIFVPGLSPYFLLPDTPCHNRRVGGDARTVARASRFGGETLLFAGAVMALVIWLGLSVAGEQVMGLKLHPLVTISAAFAAMTLVPFAAARPPSSRLWLRSAVGVLVLALVTSVGAAFVPAYSAVSPQRLNINYVENHITGKAMWAADADAPLPQSLRKVADFSNTPTRVTPLSRGLSYVAPAGALRFLPPQAQMISNMRAGKGHVASFNLRGSAGTAQMFLSIPAKAGLSGITINGKVLETPKLSDDTKNIFIGCMSADCAGANVRSQFSCRLTDGRSANCILVPPGGAALPGGASQNTVPSQSGVRH